MERVVPSNQAVGRVSEKIAKTESKDSREGYANFIRNREAVRETRMVSLTSFLIHC